MPDIDHTWGSDINLSAAGDINVVDGQPLVQERIIRRLMTRGFQAAGVNVPGEVGEYIWSPDYGAGVPQRIGGALNTQQIKSLIQSQLLREATVARSPPPQITVTNFLNGVSVLIVYFASLTGQQTQLSFDVNQ